MQLPPCQAFGALPRLVFDGIPERYVSHPILLVGIAVSAKGQKAGCDPVHLADWESKIKL
jgi:hypothetical protein